MKIADMIRIPGHLDLLLWIDEGSDYCPANIETGLKLQLRS